MPTRRDRLIGFHFEYALGLLDALIARAASFDH
jgi:hypothetical protein